MKKDLIVIITSLMLLTSCTHATTHRNISHNSYLKWGNQEYIITDMINKDKVNQKIGTGYNPLNKSDTHDVYSIKNEKETIVTKESSGYYLLEPPTFTWKTNEYTITNELQISQDVKKKIKTIGYVTLLGEKHTICSVEVNKTPLTAIELNNRYFVIQKNK